MSGAGLAAQRAAIIAEAERRGWTIVQTIEDAGYSAKDLKRPGVQTALEMLRAGAADALVVAKLDRVSRSMVDFAGLMSRASKEGWALLALDCAVDTTSPSGEVMAHLLAAFAQYERRLIGERTKTAMAAKRRQGVRFGRPPVLPDALRARITADRAAGMSLAAIAAQLNSEGIRTAQGGRQWWPSTVRAVLQADANRKAGS